MLLPIVERELRTASRLKATYLGRLPGPGVAMFIILVMLVNTGEIIRAQNFNMVYLVVAGILFLSALMAGVRTADSISSEKRNDTLGLLFLTDLKGKDVILGKLVSNCTFDFYGLLAAAPVLYMTSFFGGVQWFNMFYTILCVLNTLLFSASIGLFISCYSFQQKKASSTAIGTVIFLTAGLPAIAAGYRLDPWFLQFNLDGLFLFSPAYTFAMTLPTAFGLSTNQFWTSAALQFAISIVLLCFSSFMLPHLWQIKAPKEPYWRRMTRLLVHGNEEQKKRRRFRLLNRNPILWMTARNRLDILTPWWIIVIFALVGYVIAKKNNLQGRDILPLIIGECVVLNMVFLVSIGGHISRWLLQDRQSGALELVTATPITEKTITRGLWTATATQYVPPLLFLLLVEVITFTIVMLTITFRPGDRQEIFGAVFIVGILLHMGFVAMGWAGLWYAMRVSMVKNAIGMAILRVVTVPFILFGFINILAYYSPWRSWWENHEFWFFFGMLACLHFTNLFLLLTKTRKNFYLQFRTLASDRGRYIELHGWAVRLQRLLSFKRTNS